MTAGPDRGAGGRRGALARGAGWLALAVAAFGFSAFYSNLAPCGNWSNRIFGQPAWSEDDPGAFYVASAHELGWGTTPLFVGHPGATLTPLLWGVQRLLYVEDAPDGISFGRFTAQNLATVFFASKLLMTGLYGISLVALYWLALLLLGSRRGASFAVLGYATSLPVLYSLSRISVEPLMITFLALAFVAVWRSQELVARGRRGAALAWAGAAGVAAVSGAMSKLSFLGPLPFFLALYLAVGPRLESSGGGIAPGTRRLALAVFAAASLAALAVYSGIVDWSRFYSVWRPAVAQSGGGWTLSDWVPGLGAHSIFLASELGFCIASAAGVVLFLRRRRPERGRALWLLAYGAWGLALWAYRVALQGDFLPFHYFFVAQAVLSVFFGHLTVELGRRLGRLATGWRGAVTGLAWLSVLHGLALVAVVDSRRADASEFAAMRDVYPLLERLGPLDRIGVERPPGARAVTSTQLIRLHGFLFPFLGEGPQSALQGQFESLFVAIAPRPSVSDAARPRIPGLDARVEIVSGVPPHPR